MRKALKLLIVVLMLLSLNSCFNQKEDENILDAKKQMWVIEWDYNTWNLANNPIDEIENNDKIEKNIENTNEKTKDFEIINLTNEKFLEFNNLKWINLSSWKVEISWKTLTWVDEINVEFYNATSNYPKDNYKLKTFKSWDNSFLYRAFINYETLDFWINEYIFTAKSWNEIAKTKIIINLEKEETQNTTNNFIWDINFELLPTWKNFWNPKQIWDWKITYSDIKWLEIIKKDPYNFDCSINPETDQYYITEILKNNLNSQFMWNTCRSFWENNWISYFVLKLDWKDYVYEKHIYLNNWIYWTYEIERQKDFISDEDNKELIVTKLQNKNNELKNVNDQFITSKIINDLFTQILYNLKN